MTERDIQLAIVAHWRSSIVVAAPNYTPREWWECDVWGVTKAGYGIEWEIKLSVADFRADAQKGRSHYLRGVTMKHDAISTSEHAPSRFWYVVPNNLGIGRDDVPEWAGLAYAYERYKGRCSVRPIKNPPQLNKAKVGTREIRLCRQRMWYRYWECLKAMNRNGVIEPTETPEVPA